MEASTDAPPGQPALIVPTFRHTVWYDPPNRGRHWVDMQIVLTVDDPADLDLIRQAFRPSVSQAPPMPEAEQVEYWDHWSGPERKRVLDWIVETCLIHGTQESTAYLVASEFAKGLDRAR
jgi:hypothetical protein